jgi:acyl-CoA thioesterase-1
MIMAVIFRLMLAVALAVAFNGCGNDRKPEAAAPVTAANPAPAPVQPDSRPVIAAFGDSVSAGFGVEPGKSFPDDLQRLLDAEGFRYRVVNLGVNGDTTSDGVERLPSVLAVKPEIVLLEFGGNDGLRGQPVASSKQNLRLMTEALQKAGAKVVVAGMTLPRNYGPDYIQAFEKMYVDVAAEFRLVSIVFLLEGVGGNPRLMQADGIHPTAEGADIVAHTVMSSLRPILTK